MPPSFGMEFRRFNIHLKEAGGKELLDGPVYATLCIVGSSSPKQKASIENQIHRCGSSLSSCRYSSSMRFYIEDTKLQHNKLVLMVQILRKRILRCDKVIGEVCVPLKELYDSCGGVCTENFSFQPIVTTKTVIGKPMQQSAFLCFTYEFSVVTIKGAMRNIKDTTDDVAARHRYRVTPSAPCLEYLTEPKE
ncbi:hypothetical protein PIB30_019956 [Stylosanthes scabra]|uniref:Arrestin-like N-terminal domain-containing protein n=1 Tax=Stylosanthes scabra TaxID=79078 RepID=A0ABU6X944_9FABA|nr:hypothetical protein [Stylosanthes scabra]